MTQSMGSVLRDGRKTNRLYPEKLCILGGYLVTWRGLRSSGKGLTLQSDRSGSKSGTAICTLVIPESKINIFGLKFPYLYIGDDNIYFESYL